MNLAEELKQEIDNLKAQQKNALEVYQQATGALALAEHLLKRLEADSMTVQEFAEAIGGAGAVATIEKAA